VDFSEYRVDPDDKGPPTTVASATITIPTAGSSPADHLLLVIGQAMVDCCANGEVEWQLYLGADPGGPPFGQRPYEAKFNGTFIMSVSRLLTVPAGEHTIALKVTNRSASPIDVEQTSLSVIDLGSV
jgi:hypothetical protein